MAGMTAASAPIVLPGTGPVPWRYHADHIRPHVHPVTTPAGHELTRDAPPDHPWHHALWFTIKFVDGDNFWEEMEPYGTLRHRGEPTIDRGELTGSIDWLRPDSTDVALRQTVRLAVVEPTPADSVALDVDITITADDDVLLDRTPFTTWGGYGGLAFRGRPDLVDSVITLADGSTHDRVLGERSRWFDLSGHLGTERHPVGVTVIDGGSPGERPVPWYGSCKSSTYGDEGWSNFFNAAFLWDDPMKLPAGETMTFSYRVIAHDGLGDVDRTAAQAAEYRATDG
jgi:hypothetical protein